MRGSRRREKSRAGLSNVAETVTRGIDLVPAEAPKLPPDAPVALLPEVSPPRVTQLGGVLGGADEVGAKDGGA